MGLTGPWYYRYGVLGSVVMMAIVIKFTMAMGILKMKGPGLCA